MKIKSVIAVISAGILLMSCMCSCADKNENSPQEASSEITVSDTTVQSADTLSESKESTAQGEANQSETAEEIYVELPTNKGGTLEDSNMVVTDMTVYDRKSDSTLIRETQMKKLELKKKTVENDGEKTELYTCTYQADKNADVVYFSLVCSLEGISNIVLGREFTREDGNDSFETKYITSDGNTYPLKVSVQF